MAYYCICRVNIINTAVIYRERIPSHAEEEELSINGEIRNNEADCDKMAEPTLIDNTDFSKNDVVIDVTNPTVNAPPIFKVVLHN